MSAVNMTNAQIHPKSAHSTSSPLPDTLPHINPITGPAMDLYEDGYSDPVYHAKARILNHAIQDIGMGRYQVCRIP